MRRDPRQIGAGGASEEQEHARSVGRAWGIVLGGWVVLFAVLGLVGVPVLFSLCERAG